MAATKQDAAKSMISIFNHPEKRGTFNFTDTFKVLVGPEDDAESFTLHKCCATESSRFFAAALKEEWKEGQDRIVKLLEADKKAFALYVQWVYRREIRFADLSETEHPATTDKIAEGNCVRNLTRLYVLGDRLCDNDLQDFAIDGVLQYRDYFDRLPGVPSIKIAWAGTSQGSALRRLILDCWAAAPPPAEWFAGGHFSGTPGEFKDEFVARCCQMMLGKGVVDRPTTVNRKRYHQQVD